MAFTHPGHKKKPSYAIFLNYTVLNVYRFQSGFTDIMYHVPKGTDFIISFNNLWCNHITIKTFPKWIRQAHCVRSFISIQCGCRLVCRQACRVLLSELHSLYPMTVKG